jgi:uncharacterized Tic20 family protein
MKYEDLKLLDELREKGSITEEEYQREKEKILNGIPPNPPPTPTPLWGLDERLFLILMHISQFLLPIIAPLIMWLTNKDFNENVNRHGKNCLNFGISYAIYTTVLLITIIGAFLVPLLLILAAIFIIIATIKAANGEVWRYPLTIEFFK